MWTKVSSDSEKPQDQPSQDDEHNSPKVARILPSLKGELILTYVQVIDQQPDGLHSDPPEPETGSQDDDDGLLEVSISMVPLGDASLVVVTD